MPPKWRGRGLWPFCAGPEHDSARSCRLIDMAVKGDSALVDRYIELGLSLGIHIQGFVDAFYGPKSISERV